jgi:predicted enzyme related to lactoylglutathione lyase
LDRTSAFYQECFAFEVVDSAAGDYKVLESQAWTLSLVQVPADIAQSIVVSDPPLRRDGTPIKLAFDVNSLTAHRAMIVSSGGRIDESEWVFRGYRHCDFVDPEGNIGQLRESVQAGI